MVVTKRFLAVLLLPPFLLLWGLFLFFWVGTPTVLPLRVLPPASTSYMSLHDGPDGAVRWDWVPMEQISPYLQRAVVVAEDDQFLEHPGFNWEAIQKAWRFNQKKGRLVRGASTITQQLARNLYLNPHKNFWRKFQELVIAMKLEFFLPKERILEIYLNVAEWGPGVFGAEAASHYHFGKSASHLSHEEAAYLASILPKPSHMRPRQSTPSTQRKMERILNQL